MKPFFDKSVGPVLGGVISLCKNPDLTIILWDLALFCSDLAVFSLFLVVIALVLLAITVPSALFFMQNQWNPVYFTLNLM